MADYSDVITYMQNGRKIEAIKEMRIQTDLGLKEAKDLVEAFYDFVRPVDKFEAHATAYDQKPYKPEEYVVFSSSNNANVYDWTLAYQGNFRDSAACEAESAANNGLAVRVCKVVASTKTTVVWND